ncbi:hypothetical protein ANO11243_059460 [Dothideomycetidae sp. 11243]|nr:hypothetical protein ANO11243_059460 [fungal sp. No.11243]
MNINDRCNYTNQKLAAANVTNNFTLPGFVPDKNGQTAVSNNTADLWTFTVAVVQNGTTLNTELRNFVEIPPPDSQLPDSNSTSVWNPAPLFCEMFFAYEVSTMPLQESPDGRCTNVASSQCLSDLEKYYLEAARSYVQGTPVWTVASESDDGYGIGQFCSNFFAMDRCTAKWPSSCNGFLQTFSDKTDCPSDGAITNIYNDTCPIILSESVPGDSTDTAGQHNAYDRMTNGITSRVMIRFGNASKTDTGVDVQILCPSASGPNNKTSPGSRNVKLHNQAGKRQVVGMTSLVIALIAAISVLL